MAFLGRSRLYWWRRHPLFGVLDALFIGSFVLGFALLFVSIPAAVAVLLLGPPMFWFIRNAYIRPIAYRELGMDPDKFAPEVLSEMDSWRYLGVAAWSSGRAPQEAVKVLLNDEGKYFFQTADGYLYGENVGGGYGPEELFTLYLEGRLSLNPNAVARLSNAPAAVIRNENGQALFVDTRWRGPKSYRDSSGEGPSEII